jgi:hypothetical protein
MFLENIILLSLDFAVFPPTFTQNSIGNLIILLLRFFIINLISFLQHFFAALHLIESYVEADV